WILNKGQQARAAMLAGLPIDRLASAIGLPRGARSAAGGSEVQAGNPEDATTGLLFSSEAERARLARLERGVYELPMVELTSWEQIIKELKRVHHAINEGGKKIRK